MPETFIHVKSLVACMFFLGPVPPKVQNAIKKARKLGNSLVQFLEQSKNIRAMFKETQTEVDHTAIINYLAQASARLVEC